VDKAGFFLKIIKKPFKINVLTHLLTEGIIIATTGFARPKTTHAFLASCLCFLLIYEI
jgi:hypothetical protein